MLKILKQIVLLLLTRYAVHTEQYSKSFMCHIHSVFRINKRFLQVELLNFK